MIIRLLGIAFLFIAFPAFSLAFSDVPASHKNAEAIEYIAEEGIISGFSDGTFQLEKQISRAAFTKIVVSASVTENTITNCTESFSRPQMSIVFFSDVTKDDWFAPYACVAGIQQIISGFSDNTFRPANTITLAAAAKIITKAFDIPTQDMLHENLWHLPGIIALENLDVISSDEDPWQRITRGQTAEMLYRILSLESTENNITQESILSVHKKIQEKNTSSQKKTEEEKTPNDSCQKPEFPWAGCLKGEVYDEILKRCVRKCAAEGCARLDKAIDNKMENLFEVPMVTNDAYQSETPIMISTYTIKNNSIQLSELGKDLDPYLQKIQKNSSEHKEIWTKVQKIFPKKYFEPFTEFQIFSDGAGKITGEAYQQKKGGGFSEKWGLAFDPKDNDDLAYSILHELGHAIVITDEEMEYDQQYYACHNEGVQKKTVRKEYLTSFTETFWEPYGDDFWRISNMEDSAKKEREIQSLSKKYIDFFLTEYSLTNPTEDFCETFAHFVLLPKPASDTAIADQKILFFYDYPEFIRLRDSLRWSLFLEF